MKFQEKTLKTSSKTTLQRVIVTKEVMQEVKWMIKRGEIQQGWSIESLLKGDLHERPRMLLTHFSVKLHTCVHCSGKTKKYAIFHHFDFILIRRFEENIVYRFRYSFICQYTWTRRQRTGHFRSSSQTATCYYQSKHSKVEAIPLA